MESKDLIEIKPQRVDALYRQSIATISASVTAALILIIVLWGEVAASRLMSWFLISPIILGGDMKKKCLGWKIAFFTVFFLVFTSSLTLADTFNWRTYEGTTIRAFFTKSGFNKITKKHLQMFEQLTGIKVQVEYYPSAPLRQKLIMELGAKNKDLDVFAGMMKTAYQYEHAGWLEPLGKYISNPLICLQF